MVKFRSWIAPAIAIAVLAIALWWGGRTIEKTISPEPESIVSASLEGLRAQNRLTAFTGSYVAVVTSKQTRFGLTAEKTIILPGLVRYEVDLGKLSERDVRWDGERGELFVTLPPVELVGPQIDLNRMREYDQGGLLMRISDAGERLDAANRRAAQTELLRQARQPAAMSLAKDASRRAIERSFALPLTAAGLDGRVRVRFADEPDFPAAPIEQMDRSKPWEQVYNGAE